MDEHPDKTAHSLTSRKPRIAQILISRYIAILYHNTTFLTNCYGLAPGLAPQESPGLGLARLWHKMVALIDLAAARSPLGISIQLMGHSAALRFGLVGATLRFVADRLGFE